MMPDKLKSREVSAFLNDLCLLTRQAAKASKRNKTDTDLADLADVLFVAATKAGATSDMLPQ
jgi:hypothetical protein